MQSHVQFAIVLRKNMILIEHFLNIIAFFLTSKFLLEESNF